DVLFGKEGDTRAMPAARGRHQCVRAGAGEDGAGHGTVLGSVPRRGRVAASGVGRAGGGGGGPGRRPSAGAAGTVGCRGGDRVRSGTRVLARRGARVGCGAADVERVELVEVRAKERRAGRGGARKGEDCGDRARPHGGPTGGGASRGPATRRSG